MSTAVTKTANSPAEVVPQGAEDRSVRYMPLGAKDEVKLTVPIVLKYFCVPTKKGVYPTEADAQKFIMLCKARELDPRVGDAYLVGYDGYDGPVFSLITAVQALLKRAELNPNFNGLESGVIVQRGTDIQFRPGDFVMHNETLLGGWAKCHRKDQSIVSYDAVNLSTFNSGQSRWKKDPAGMIVKCAEASVLRRSFPTQLSGVFTAEEMAAGMHDRIKGREANETTPVLGSLDQLAQKMSGAPAIGQQPQQPQQQPQSESTEEEPAEPQENGSSRGHEAPADSSGPAESEDETKQRILFQFATARGRGAAALEKCYADHCGPDSTMKLSDELYKFATDCYEENKKKLPAPEPETVEAPKKRGKPAQQNMLPNDGGQTYPQGE